MSPTSATCGGVLFGDDDDGEVLNHSGKRQHKIRPSSTPSIKLPDPLKGNDSDGQESFPMDGSPMRGGPLSLNMNQSIFNLIAAAGSRVDFNERFDDGSSSEEDEPSAHPMIQSVEVETSKRKSKGKISSHKLLKSLYDLPRRKNKIKKTSSQFPPPAPNPKNLSPQAAVSQAFAAASEADVQRSAPVLSRMLQARAEMSSRPSFDLVIPSSDVILADQVGEVSLLARRLMEIFEFDEPEHVIEGCLIPSFDCFIVPSLRLRPTDPLRPLEYPCWLLQSVLLQGFLYITTKHICFYAYLPKKANIVAKSGYLSKCGKRNPKYNRYWFRLKGDVLSYYRDSTNLYFPHGQIDLRFGISASVLDREKDAIHFNLITSHRTYNFRADSAPSAKEWVKSLQRVIFRSHNDGDSVKISLPIDNIIDVEETQMIEFTDTCKIRVIDNDETYAVDEYFFSFFTSGRDAINVLKILVEESASAVQKIGMDLIDQQNDCASTPPSSGRPKSAGRNDIDAEQHRIAKVPEPVRATISPSSSHATNPSPRVSHEISSRTSLDALRYKGRRSQETSRPLRERNSYRSFSGSRSRSRRRVNEKTAQFRLESSDSNLPSSVDEPSFANLASSGFETPSASQILRGSDVFQNPTMLQSSHSPASSQSVGVQGQDADRTSQQPQASDLPHQSASVDPGGLLKARDDPHGQFPSTPTLQNLTKMGSHHLQRAGALAGYLNKTGKRMSSLLAAESMGYVEKVSGMWKGGRKHYDEPSGLRPDEDELERDSEDRTQTLMERFRAHFALPETERLQATYFGHILRVLPLYGKIYISDRSFCFRSLLPGTRTKLILPLKDIETAHKEKGFRFGYSGLVVVIRGHEELFFEFGHAEVRDDCAVTLLQVLETSRYLQEAGIIQREERQEESFALAERDALKSARQERSPDEERHLSISTANLLDTPTILHDEADGSFLNFKPQQPLRITCLTIGSRGDVQPYIALCKGLLAEGHKPRIATHAEFQEWIESYGIEFSCVEGDPAELMRLCIENGTFTLAFLREANATFRGWLDDLLCSAYRACQGAELLIESPSAMAGIHIAEKLGIPYFRAFTMPWTRTRAYPHAFIMPEYKMGGAYNYMTYVMFDNIFWKATAYQINRWRNKTLGLPNTSLEKMQPNKVPFLYNFSPSVVAPPLDFSDWIRVTGYWFLDEGDQFEPPQELREFIDNARQDGKKLVYVGFGSIIVNDPAKMTQEVIDAVLKADVRCILSKGWSDRISSKDDPSKPRSDEPELPPEILAIKSAPHDWLFGQIDAAAHHGGSGTTGASLRAGLPTIIRPFFGDQYFFASRVEDLGVGIWVKRWGSNSFGRALWEATHNERMIRKAHVLGEQIRKEKGVQVAIQSIHRDLEYARSLIKHNADKQLHPDNEEDDDDMEESWTFVGNDIPDVDAPAAIARMRGKDSEVLSGGRCLAKTSDH